MNTSTDSIQGTRSMRPRTSRAALSDISNKIKSGFSEVAKKVTTTTKKRKLSEPGDNNHGSHEVVDLTENPLSDSSSSAAPVIVTVGQTVRTSPANPNKVVIASNASLNLNAPLPRRTRRTLQMHSKSLDPAQCLDSIDDMYDIYHQQETKYAISAYMSKQTDINFKMRSILVDWLVEVHHKFKLQTATLWLCVNILDRFLETTVILRSKLQLVGVTSLFIACKFEELYPPEVRDCVYITDFAYDREEVLKMESTILQTLNYDIFVPTGYHFLTRYLNCIKASERTRLVAAYYSERNLQEQDTLCLPPHKFAAAVVFAALRQQNCQYDDHEKLAVLSSWPRMLREETGFTEADLLPHMTAIVKHVSEEPQTTSKRKLVAAKKKYSVEKFQNISALPLPGIY